jgi:exonuclease III
MTNISYVFGSWNIRGLGQQQKCDDMLTKLVSLNPSMLFLQETKLNEIPTLKAKEILHYLTNFHFKPSLGSAGGILNAPSSTHFSPSQKSNKLSH